MGIIAWLALGLVAGLLAKMIMPGQDPGGLIVTIVLGIAGALVGGFIGAQIGWGSIRTFDFRSLLLAVGGAVLLLMIYRVVKQRTAAP